MAKKDPNVIIDEGCPCWMLTMGDSMSLLLCFFVLLLTFSTPNESKLMDVIGGMQGALSLIAPSEVIGAQYHFKNDPDAGQRGKVERGEKDPSLIAKSSIAPIGLNSMDVVNRYNQFKDRLMRLGFKNIVSTREIEEGIVVTVNNDELFQPNSAVLLQGAKQILENYANLIDDIENEVAITACFHTYNIQASRSGIDPWDLGMRRAISLGAYFRRSYNLPRYRFSYASRILTKPGPDHFEFLLYERYPISEVSIADLIRTKDSTPEAD